MTDVIYLDEYGNAVDDGAEIHELIDRITDMLAVMTKAERLNWFRKSQYPYPINFQTEIDGTVYSVNMILSRLVDTFSSRILYPMLLLSGNHSIAVV